MPDLVAGAPTLNKKRGRPLAGRVQVAITIRPEALRVWRRRASQADVGLGEYLEPFFEQDTTPQSTRVTGALK